MDNLINISVLHKVLQALSCLALSLFLLGAPSQSKSETNIGDELFTSIKDITKSKSIFVFMDGTANNRNDPSEQTNVYRTFEIIKNSNNSQITAYYIEGVGNANDPELAGKALGFGMDEKILKGYQFITEHYRPGDHIYIFGFSRGAHTARSLAGLVSYAGIPKLSEDERNNKDSLENLGNSILAITQDVRDNEYAEKWKQWKSGDAPLLAELIRDSKINGKKGREVYPAEIKFLGVWDTVPGSTFKDDSYFKLADLSCKESIGIIKKAPLKIPGITEGERYKIDSYPAIHNIAHAVSNDEKRSKFRPLFLCSSNIGPGIYNPTYTKLSETLFPGAHADVGGGYEDNNNDLPNISLNWMINLLVEHYNFPSPPPKFLGNPKGLAHLSISDPAASIFSDCRDRGFPKLIAKDRSISERENAGPVPLAVMVSGAYQEIKTEQKNVNCDYISQQKWDAR